MFIIIQESKCYLFKLLQSFYFKNGIQIKLMGIDIMKKHERLDIIMETCGRSKILENKDNYLTQEVTSDKKGHEAQESKKTKFNLEFDHQTLHLQDATIHYTKNLQLKDQEDSHI
jgi:hypothetical protein